jgi:hypothetical protein
MRRRHLLLTAVVVAGALSLGAGADARTSWRLPVDGPVKQNFNYRRAAPFERGARRGVEFGARAGQVVHAACSGIVSYAGPTPKGEVVTLRCGALVATHLGLANTNVARGAAVRAGSPIGKAGADGVGLGARRFNDRWGYVDPLRLMAPRAPALGPVPSGRFRRLRRPALEPDAGPRPVRAHSARESHDNAPLAAWVALALVAATLGGAAGGAVSSVRRRWGPSTSPRRSTM